MYDLIYIYNIVCKNDKEHVRKEGERRGGCEEYINILPNKNNKHTNNTYPMSPWLTSFHNNLTEHRGSYHHAVYRCRWVPAAAAVAVVVRCQRLRPQEGSSSLSMTVELPQH